MVAWVTKATLIGALKEKPLCQIVNQKFSTINESAQKILACYTNMIKTCLLILRLA